MSDAPTRQVNIADPEQNLLLIMGHGNFFGEIRHNPQQVLHGANRYQ